MHRYRTPNRQRPNRLPLAAAICFAIAAPAFAQDAPPEADKKEAAKPAERTANIGTVTVTAQKREQNLQEVPISVQVLGTQQLEELNVSDFRDYVKMLPSVSFDSGEAGGATPYFRGVASGENSNHSGPQPSVGVYMDEQPVTTIGGVLDVHIYDVARVESLAGPQGTLYGASSQAGTLKIITNKPDPSGFSGAYSLEANGISSGGNGHVLEGFVNIPLSDRAAIRLVAWDQRDAGYIDNVPGSRTFASGISMNNSDVAGKDYNDVHTSGARAALKIDLNDEWTITPSIMTQRQDVDGSFASDPVQGELAIRRFYPEQLTDKWTQSALTIQGKLGNFDLTYAFAHLRRDIDTDSDYSDYGYWYDAYYQYYYEVYLGEEYNEFIVDNNGDPINPSQQIHGEDRYGKRSHELRISSPQDQRFRFLVGAFWQVQTHKILQNYYINGLADDLQVPGWSDTLWLTNQFRRDKDTAFFGEVSYDFTEKLTGTAGLRHYSYDNSLKGFFGFSANVSGNYGEALCFSNEQFQGAPCVNLDGHAKDNGNIGRLNLTYKIDDKRLIYGTWSEGFRPGGLNRKQDPGDPVGLYYQPDFLTNWEFGWKTSWLDNRITWNGAIFQEDWDDMQFSFIPPGGAGLTVIRNAGAARIRGLETDIVWAVNYNFRLSGGVAFYDAKLTEDYCGFNDINGEPVSVCPAGTINPRNPDDPDDDVVVDGPQAPEGTRLPVTARFKGNLTGRYTWDIGENEMYIQGVLVHEGDRRSALLSDDSSELGDLGAYTTFDLSAGIRRKNWSLDFYVRNLFDERGEMAKFTQCSFACVLDGLVPEYPTGQVYTIYNKPRSFGIRFSQEF